MRFFKCVIVKQVIIIKFLKKINILNSCKHPPMLVLPDFAAGVHSNRVHLACWDTITTQLLWATVATGRWHTGWVPKACQACTPCADIMWTSLLLLDPPKQPIKIIDMDSAWLIIISGYASTAAHSEQYSIGMKTTISPNVCMCRC